MTPGLHTHRLSSARAIPSPLRGFAFRVCLQRVVERPRRQARRKKKPQQGGAGTLKGRVRGCPRHVHPDGPSVQRQAICRRAICPLTSSGSPSSRLRARHASRAPHFVGSILCRTVNVRSSASVSQKRPSLHTRPRPCSEQRRCTKARETPIRSAASARVTPNGGGLLLVSPIRDGDGSVLGRLRLASFLPVGRIRRSFAASHSAEHVLRLVGTRNHFRQT